MTKKEVKFLEDMKAFIDYAIINKPSFSLVLSTLGHDVNGLFDYKTDKFFLPRTHDYKKRMALEQIVVPVYFSYEDDAETKKLFDTDSMTQEFERKLAEVTDGR